MKNNNTNSKYDESKAIREYLNKINKDDLLAMFGSSVVSYIMNMADMESKLLDYLQYDVSVNIGDIIEYKYEKYVVTCVYTDKSVDILGDNAKKQNVGLYNKKVKTIGKLQVIKEY